MSVSTMVAQLLYTTLLVLVFVCIVLAARPILHRYANAKWAYLLWLAALAPVVFVFVPLPTFLFLDYFSDPTGVFDRLIFGSSFTAVWWHVAGLVWALGAVASLFCFWKQSSKLNVTVNRTLNIPSSTMRSQYEGVCAKAGVHPPPSLRVSSALKTPMLFGVVNPTMVIPDSFTEDYSNVEQELVLYHELVHFRRRDAYCNLIFRICRALFWFAPFLRAAEKSFRADQERSCDFSVLRDESPPTRGHYASAILKTVSTCSLGSTATPFRSNGSDLLGRTEALAHHKTSLPRSLFGATCVAALIVLAVQIAPQPGADLGSLFSSHSWCSVYSGLGL